MTIFVPKNYVLEQKVVAHVVYNVDAMVMHTNKEREIKHIFIMYILSFYKHLPYSSVLNLKCAFDDTYFVNSQNQVKMVRTRI